MRYVNKLEKKSSDDFISFQVESRPVDVEMLQLLNDVFRVENLNHLYRGYTVLPPRGIVNTQLREIQYSPGEKKEIWYIFSGMGSQWVGMG